MLNMNKIIPRRLVQMDKGLAGKVCLVTGGSRGIGAEICRAMASEGVKLAINYYNSEPAALKLLEK
jgi:3-oxoacyl-[acyl-carrier protein] reductase